MRVSEVMTYNKYYRDPRFQKKKPNLFGSLKQAYGDNIYRKNSRGSWKQMDSHHSFAGGRPNPQNVKHDTRVDRVLIGTQFTYWGGSGPKIPKRFRDYRSVDICHSTSGHKCRFPEQLVQAFVTWIESSDNYGYKGEPLEFRS